MNVKEITEKYNKARKNFKFPTTGATESGIQSILDMYPELLNEPEEAMLEKIGVIIYELAFG